MITAWAAAYFSRLVQRRQERRYTCIASTRRLNEQWVVHGVNQMLLKRGRVADCKRLNERTAYREGCTGRGFEPAQEAEFSGRGNINQGADAESQQREKESCVETTKRRTMVNGGEE